MSDADYQNLRDRIEVLEKELEKLKKDSHPPVDIVYCIRDALKRGELDEEVKFRVELFR